MHLMKKSIAWILWIVLPSILFSGVTFRLWHCVAAWLRYVQGGCAMIKSQRSMSSHLPFCIFTLPPLIRSARCRGCAIPGGRHCISECRSCTLRVLAFGILYTLSEIPRKLLILSSLFSFHSFKSFNVARPTMFMALRLLPVPSYLSRNQITYFS